MSTSAHQHARQHAKSRRWLPYAVAIGALAGIAAIVVALLPSGSGGAASDGLRRTGETNEMGMPVVATPGAATGSASAGGVSVENANWSLGHVPLLVAVRPSWVLRNTGSEAVTIGEPTAEVRKGCCPGPFALSGPATVPPGGSTTLSFELSMHPGMDGWHDMAVHVPVQSAGHAVQMLDLSVTGDFTG